MTALEILRRARDRISVPERWTRLSSALNADGMRVDPQSTEAVCWCPIGAMFADGATFDHAAYEALADACNGRLIVQFNDTHSHAEVIRAFDIAIASLESKGAR